MLAGDQGTAGNLPDKRGVHDSRHDTNSDSLLLWCLPASRSAPSQNQGVYAVSADGEDNHGNITTSDPNVCACKTETEDCDQLRDGNVPGALVKLAGRPGHGDGDTTSDQVWGACKDKRDSTVEAESLDDGGEEVFESVCGKLEVVLLVAALKQFSRTLPTYMHMSHESENPNHWILTRLLESGPD